MGCGSPGGASPQRCPLVAESQAPCPLNPGPSPRSPAARHHPQTAPGPVFAAPASLEITYHTAPPRVPFWGAGHRAPGKALWSPTSSCKSSFSTSSESKRPFPVSPWPPSDLGTRRESLTPTRGHCWAGRGPGHPRQVLEEGYCPWAEVTLTIPVHLGLFRCKHVPCDCEPDPRVCGEDAGSRTTPDL